MDLELILPVCLSGKYKARLDDFRRYGLYNTGKHRVRLVLLAGPGDYGPYTTGWPPGVEVAVRQTPFDSAVQKIFTYYANMDCSAARWFGRIDDDSLNDLDGTVDLLDAWYDWQKDYYVAGELRQDVHAVEQAIMAKFGFDWFYRYRSPWHEWEACWVSRAAMTRLTTEEPAKSIIQMRAGYHQGFGDHCLALAARAIKMYPTVCDRMAPRSKFALVSKYGGPFVHVHYVTRENTPYIYEFLDNDAADTTDWAGKTVKVEAKNNLCLYRLDPNHRLLSLSVNRDVGIWTPLPSGKVLACLWHGPASLVFDKL